MRTTDRRSLTATICLVFTLPAAAQGLEWVHSPAMDIGAPNGGGPLVEFDDGSGPALYVAGEYPSGLGTPVSYIGRWNGSTWSAVGAGLSDFGQGNGTVLSLLVHDDGTGPALYAGGSFQNSGVTSLHDIARWNGIAWSSVSASGMNGLVTSLVTFDDGSGPALYAGGNFTMAGGVPANGIARWNGSAWSALPTFPMSIDGVYCLAVHSDASGTSLFAGGLRHTSLSSLGFVARLQGGAWTEAATFSGPTLTSFSQVISLYSHDDGTGSKLYAGGRFTDVDGTTARGIARRVGTTWQPVGAGWNEAVLSLVTYDDGTGPALYASGGFTDVLDGVAVNRVSRWTPAGWSILGRGVSGSSCYLAVASLGSTSGADLYAGGDISGAGGLPAHALARWTRAGPSGGPYCFGDGSGLACPCGNASPSVDRAGCAASFGMGGRITATGQARVSGDTLAFSADQVPSGTTMLFFQGTTRTNHGGGVHQGDGLRCASGTVVRRGSVSAGAGAAAFPASGGAPLHVAGFTSPGATRTYQAMYRNKATFCTPAGFNFTNGWIVQWLP